jgi:hypothetical protein
MGHGLPARCARGRREPKPRGTPGLAAQKTEEPDHVSAASESRSRRHRSPGEAKIRAVQKPELRRRVTNREQKREKNGAQLGKRTRNEADGASQNNKPEEPAAQPRCKHATREGERTEQPTGGAEICGRNRLEEGKRQHKPKPLGGGAQLGPVLCLGRKRKNREADWRRGTLTLEEKSAGACSAARDSTGDEAGRASMHTRLN